MEFYCKLKLKKDSGKFKKGQLVQIPYLDKESLLYWLKAAENSKTVTAFPVSNKNFIFDGTEKEVKAEDLDNKNIQEFKMANNSTGLLKNGNKVVILQLSPDEIQYCPNKFNW